MGIVKNYIHLVILFNSVMSKAWILLCSLVQRSWTSFLGCDFKYVFALLVPGSSKQSPSFWDLEDLLGLSVISAFEPFIPVVQEILPLSSYPPNSPAPVSPGVQSMTLCYSHRIIE